MRTLYKPSPEIAELKELQMLLNVNSKLSPGYHGAKFIILTCGQDFEGHGRASECWELYWTLELPHIKHHWKSTTGWRVGGTDSPISFHGRTALEVIHKATAFIRECPNPVELSRT